MSIGPAEVAAEAMAKSFVRFTERLPVRHGRDFQRQLLRPSAGDSKRVEILKSDISAPLCLEEMRTQLTAHSLFDAGE